MSIYDVITPRTLSSFELMQKLATINIDSGSSNPVVATGTAAPTTGAHVVNEFVKNSSPVEQGSAGAKFIVQGWTCVVAGIPGTWVANNVFTGN